MKKCCRSSFIFNSCTRKLDIMFTMFNRYDLSLVLVMLECDETWLFDPSFSWYRSKQVKVGKAILFGYKT